MTLANSATLAGSFTSLTQTPHKLSEKQYNKNVEINENRLKVFVSKHVFIIRDHEESSMQCAVEEKIRELLDLPEDWDSYAGKKISPIAASKASIFFKNASLVLRSAMQCSLPEPFIAPLCNGGIQLEWSKNGTDLEIEFHENRPSCLLFTDSTTGEEKEIEEIANINFDGIGFVLKLFGDKSSGQ